MNRLHTGTEASISLQPGEKRSICGICPAGCWVITRVENGKLVDVRPDDSHPLGAICRLGEKGPDILTSPHRLTHPLKRRGARGTFEFDEISWDEALDHIMGRLLDITEKHGARANSVYTGRGSFDRALCDIFQPKEAAISSASSLLFPLGSPNTFGVGALCYVAYAMMAPHSTFGGMYHQMFSDIENADLIVIWGSNPWTDSPPRDHDRVLHASKKGSKVIVIDPRNIETGKKTGAWWIPIRPGTDGALALGLCNLIIKRGLYDHDFVENWTVGFDEFSDYTQRFPPDVVESITGIPAPTIELLAESIARAKGVAPVMYTGLEYSNSGVQSIRAVFTLWALTGNLDTPGSRCFSMPENIFPINREGLIANPDPKNAIGRKEFPLYSYYRGESHAISIPRSVLDGIPYRLRSLIILGASLLTSWPQTSLWRRTLMELDFLVTIDVQLTADSAFADIVLPAAYLYEHESYMSYGPVFRIREKVADPPGEARSGYRIMADLAGRLGYGHLFPQNQQEVLEYTLKGSGFSPEDVREKEGIVSFPRQDIVYRKWEKGMLRPDGRPGFNTESGKFEITSSLLKEFGYPPLPLYSEPVESPLSRPDMLDEYPLVFNSGSRVRSDFRSQFHGVESLVRDNPEPLVWIHPLDADRRHILDGDRVRITSPRGEVEMKARVTADIVQGAIDASMGGGGPASVDPWKESNINECTDMGNFDPISGFPVYKALLCQIEKVEDS